MKVQLGQGVGIKSGSAQTKQVNFSIGNASVIIEILRNNFYQNKVQTLVQEYICNARDAVREKLREDVIAANKKLNPEKENAELEKLCNFNEEDGSFMSWKDEAKAKEILAKVEAKEIELRQKIAELYGKDGQPTIEVTVPTKFDSTFKVRDYGVGISPERMETVFIKYGVSTKRHSNTETGGFGIGAKSAWAYTSAFTIITYIDGIQRTYVAHIGDNQNGALRFRGECETKQPNGTEIWVPLNKETVERDIQSFREATFRATQFWKSKPIVKGMTVDEFPKCYKGVTPLMQGKGWELQDNKAFSYFNHNHDSTRMVAVIDGIPYVVGGNFMRLTNLQKVLQMVASNKMMLIQLNNGDVEVVANREQLGDSQKSLESLDKVCGKILENIQEEIVNQVNKSTSLKEYIQNHTRINGVLQKHIATKFTLDQVAYSMDSNNVLDSVHLAKALISYYRNERQRRGDKVILKEYPKTSISFGRIDSNVDNAMFMYNDTTDKDYHLREKARVLTKGEENKRVFVINKNMLNDDEMKTLIKHLAIIPSSQIEIPVVEKGERKKRETTKGTMCFHKLVPGYGRSAYKTESTNITEDAFIKSGKTYLYIPMTDGKPVAVTGIENRDFLSVVNYIHNNTTYEVVALNDKVWEKVKKQKNVMEFKDFLKNIEQYFTFSDANKAYVVVNKLSAHPFTGLLNNAARDVKERIEDAEVTETYDYYVRMKNTRAERFPCEYIQNKILPKVLKDMEKEVTEYNARFRAIEERYPLIRLQTYNNNIAAMANEFILYINAKYKSIGSPKVAKTKEKK